MCLLPKFPGCVPFFCRDFLCPCAELLFFSPTRQKDRARGESLSEIYVCYCLTGEKKKKKKRHLIHYIEIVAMNLTGKTCPEFFVKVIVPDTADTTNERRSISELLRSNVPTVIDFYNSG